MTKIIPEALNYVKFLMVLHVRMPEKKKQNKQTNRLKRKEKKVLLWLN